MCGILYTKIFSNKINLFDFELKFKSTLEKMNYRGPDASNIWVKNKNFLGHVRLSIVGLNSNFNQPYYENGCKYKMIYNGEIYNYKELDAFAKSDTQVLYKYLSKINEPFKYLRGMFSIGLYDEDEDIMCFFRDFYGEKPLYYYKDDDVFIASSTISSIRKLLHEINKTLSFSENLIKSDYLLFGYIREPNTIFREIKVLPAGHKLQLINNIITIEPIEFGIRFSKINNLDYSIGAFISSDVDKYILTSSGIDSTMLLHIIAQENINNTTPVTYKSPLKIFDESDKSIKNVKLILNRSTITLTNQIDSENLLTSMVKILEQPTSDGLNLFNLLYSLKNQKKSIKLIYTGLGGDELFGGYQSFKNWKIVNLLIRIPFSYLFFPSLKRFFLGKKILKQWNPYVYYFLYRIDFNLYKKIINDTEIIIDSFNQFLGTIEPYKKFIQNEKNPYLKIKICELFDYMKNQLLRDNDNISMFFSIESRSPLLDPDKIYCIPERRKWIKNILKQNYNLKFDNKKGFTYYSHDITKESNYNFIEKILNSKINLKNTKLEIINQWLDNNII